MNGYGMLNSSMQAARPIVSYVVQSVWNPDFGLQLEMLVGILNWNVLVLMVADNLSATVSTDTFQYQW